ncbi:phospholipase D-like protein [Flavobacterium aquaticum]|uniref:Phospholipase D-like protein n=1 Tax=Flavobacterium aquaticum TaxID=1236486 RepID=A0A327YH57_9FLAO|nr:phospholipase D-like domain-containing protein [Flavobacterium aquaticum]RAK19747.1 phospholipase D-like protein [Flavobacterium aquaticum]
MQIDFIGHGLNKRNKLNVGDQIATSLISPNFDVITGFVAFTAVSGVNKLLKFLLEAKENNKKVVFFIGVDNKGTSKQSLEILLENKIDVFIYHKNEEFITYHPKLFLFEGKTYSRVIIGSSNLTNSGFLSNIEASVQLDFRTETDKQGKKLIKEIKDYFQDIINLKDENVFKLDKELIEKYDKMGLLYSQFKSLNQSNEIQSNDGENPFEKYIYTPFFENEFGQGDEPDNKLSRNKLISISKSDFENFNYFLQKYIIYKRDIKSTGAVAKKNSDRDLYNWYKRIKELIKADALPYELASQLIDAGFPIGNAWEGQIRHTWDIRFTELVAFKNKYQSHLDFTYVPNTRNKSLPYFELGVWCVRQKRRRKGLETPKWDWNYEEEKMKSINFLWEVPENFGTNNIANEDKWAENLLKLEEYYEDEKNYNTIPKQKTYLGKWLNDQITLKLTGSRGKNKVFLHPVREALLGEVLKRNNIEWERQKQNERESIENVIQKWKLITEWDKKSKSEQDEASDEYKKEISEMRQLISGTKFRMKKWKIEDSKWKLEIYRKAGFPIPKEIDFN